MNKYQEEFYEHIKDYLDEEDELKEMCSYCERYCGKEHDYENCKKMKCFQFYLGNGYLKWYKSYE